MLAGSDAIDRARIAAFLHDLPLEGLAGERWFGGKGRSIARLELAEAFDLGDGAFVAVVRLGYNGRAHERYVVALSAVAGSGLSLAHPGDGAWRALARAIAEGRTVASMVDPIGPGTADLAAPALGGPAPRTTAALVCRPAAALPGLMEGVRGIGELDERPLGADQSNTTVVLGDRLVLKVFRRLEPGLNPDLELNAYLAEEVGFPAVPRLGGYAELVSAEAGVETVALLGEYFADSEDAYESTAERLVAWVLAPGAVALEFATEDADALGELSGHLHAALAAAALPEFEPRPANREELRGWREAAEAQLESALTVVAGLDGPVAAELRAMAPAIAEQFTVFEALASAPLLTRLHGDYHLGQVLRTAGGLVVIDFEGEPTRSLDERRRPGSPLRDVASMLRSIDHVGRSAERRATERAGGPLERVGLDLEAWRRRSRERFLAAYRRVLRETGAPIAVDEALLRAFEFEKECYEFIYAATYVPSWLWAPLEGMRGLINDASIRG